eukprot:3565343-Amphidinium_carterae.1
MSLARWSFSGSACCLEVVRVERAFSNISLSTGSSLAALICLRRVCSVSRLSVAAGPLDPLLVGGFPAPEAGDPGLFAGDPGFEA